MEKLKICIFSLCYLIVISKNTTFAQTQNYQLTYRWIDNYKSEYLINLDGSVDVVEQINFNFGTDIGHGIIRNIDYKIKNLDEKVFKVGIENITVTNNSGIEIPYTKTLGADTVNLKIGDPNKTVTGANTYIIKYKLIGALRYFDDHDELYWSPTGNNWDISILQSVTKVILPLQITSNIKTICYTGATGSMSQDCNAQVSDNSVEITTSKTLEQNQGVTFAVSFPKGIVTILEPEKEEASLLETLLISLIFILVTIAALFWYIIYPIKVFLKWLKIYKKDKLARVVAAWFESPQNTQKIQLTPAETTCIVDNNVDHKDISATIIHLAQRGFIKIIEIKPKEFRFELLKSYKDDEVVRNFEKKLLDILFKGKDSVNLKDLADDTTFATKLIKFKEMVSQELVLGGIYVDNPEKVNSKYIAIGSLAVMSFNFVLAVVGFIFGRKSATKTDYGVAALGIAKSLKNFLSSQSEQLDFQSKNQQFFEKLLPFATAFGCEKIWAKRFEGLQFTKPDWYEGTNNNGFIYAGFASSLDSSVRSSMSASTSNGSSSGFSGGFSGGGGGRGGGGSSW